MGAYCVVGTAILETKLSTQNCLNITADLLKVKTKRYRRYGISTRCIYHSHLNTLPAIQLTADDFNHCINSIVAQMVDACGKRHCKELTHHPVTQCR